MLFSWEPTDSTGIRPTNITSSHALRADLDPSRPTDLEFDFPQSARELLTKQLPRFVQEQQQLLQLAAEQGLLPEDTAAAAAAAAGAAASNSSNAGSTGQVAKTWSVQRKGGSFGLTV